MDKTSILIGIGFIALFVIPLLLLSNSGKNKKKKLTLMLRSQAKETGRSILLFDLWKTSCIGIDNKEEIIYCVSKSNGNFNKMEIDLKTVSKCILSGYNRSENNSRSKSNTKIELQFKFQNPENIKSIEFFDTKVDTFITDDDFRIPEKWLNIVNSRLLELSKGKQ